MARALAETYPDAHCELDFSTPFELLVATILSAQCTDKRVNEVTPTLFARYPNAKDVRWVQEEPANQGPWPYFGLELPERLPERMAGIKRISRRRMAAPAPGSSKVHEVEQADIIDRAFS